jgi:hypothetical protein
VKLANVNTRSEKHGEDEVPAIDLAIIVTGPNTDLDALGKELRASLFAPVADAPEELDLRVAALPVVRNPKLSPPIKIEHEQAGMTATIGYGIDEVSDVVLGAVKLHKVRVTALAFGGSVELRYSLSTTDVNERTVGKLAMLLGHEISLTLTAPDVEQVEMTPEDAGLVPLDESDAPPTAEDIFASTTDE